MDSKLAGLLNQNRSKNIAVLGFFANYPLQEYFIEGNTAIIFGKSDQFWAHICGTSKAELTVLLEKHHAKTPYYYSVEDWMIPQILKYGSAEWIMTTRRYLLDKNVTIDLPKADIVSIDPAYAGFMYAHSDYKNFISTGYIKERLNKDISAGIFIENQLAAWGFTHDDGALGFLHALEKYRKQGLGRQILASLIHQRRKAQKPVFGNIVPQNGASINLVCKIGFKADCNTSWLKLNDMEK